MGERHGGVTRRGLLWAGGLAAIPLAPAGAFDDPAGGLPWETESVDMPRPAARDPAGDHGDPAPQRLRP